MMSNDVSARKILILAANPKGTDKLRLDEEARDIKEGLRQSKERDRFIIDSEWAVRPRDVRRTILYSKPQIVHFSGHGAEDGGLAFENEMGQVQLVQPDALAGLFKLLSEYVECVILSACYSEIQADAIAQHIDFVIGMSKAIGDKAAIEFSVGFYDALGSGYHYEVAYEFGRNAIHMAGIPENLTPILKRKNTLTLYQNTNLSHKKACSKDLETSPVITYEFVLTGNIDEFGKQKLEVLVAHLKKITGDASLTLIKVESGSVKLTLEGSENGFMILDRLFNQGRLSEVIGFPVENIRHKSSDRRLGYEAGEVIELNQEALIDASTAKSATTQVSLSTLDALELSFQREFVSKVKWVDLVKWFIAHRPPKAVMGVVCKREEQNRIVVVQVFLNESHEIIKPYGRKFYAESLDEELIGIFGDNNAIIVS